MNFDLKFPPFYSVSDQTSMSNKFFNFAPKNQIAGIKPK